MTTLAPLTIKAGDTYTQVLTVTDDNGAVDLTGATLTMHLKAPGAASPALSVALALTTPLAGVATLTLSAAQTGALTPRATYAYEVECVDARANVTTPVEGLAYIAEDIG